MAAISMILAVHVDTEFRIERREPLPAELDDPDIWVIDIGDRHEPPVEGWSILFNTDRDRHRRVRNL